MSTAASVPGAAGYVAEPAKQVPLAYDVDVAVAGAGIAGLFAALASARQGARTLLIDRFGSPGGNIGPAMIVAGGVFNQADGTLVGGLAGVPSDARQHSRLEAALRTTVFETVQFVRRHAPGLERAYLLFVAPYFGARGGPFIDSECTISPAEAYSGARFDDVLFRNIHEGLPAHGGEKSGFDAPYRMLLPKGLDGLLVTGRCAGYLRRGHDPTGMRARPSIMALGEATGIAAAQAARTGGSTRYLDVRPLQQELLRQGFYLGESARLQELGLAP